MGISRTTLYRLVTEGQLPTVRIGSRVLVKRSDVEAVLNQPPTSETKGGRGRPRRI
jgi:excisionase family DNA binding protein